MVKCLSCFIGMIWKSFSNSMPGPCYSVRYRYQRQNIMFFVSFLGFKSVNQINTSYCLLDCVPTSMFILIVKGQSSSWNGLTWRQQSPQKVNARGRKSLVLARKINCKLKQKNQEIKKPTIQEYYYFPTHPKY